MGEEVGMKSFPRGKKHYLSRLPRKASCPWRSSEKIEDACLERRKKDADPVEWTPEELDRIWRSTSG